MLQLGFRSCILPWAADSIYGNYYNVLVVTLIKPEAYLL